MTDGPTPVPAASERCQRCNANAKGAPLYCENCSVHDLLSHIRTVTARAEAAEARAETARATAIDEAAKIVEGIDILGRYVMWPQWSEIGNRGRESELVKLTESLAKAIRALLTAPPPTAKEG